MSVLRSGIKLTLFVVLSLFLTLVVTNTVTRPINQATVTYRALFTDASGLRPGDDVDISGVRVGRVTGEKLAGPAGTCGNGQHYPDDALVTFEIDKTQRFTTAASANIRYEDLLGARFLAIEQAKPSPQQMATGSTFCPSNTSPALSLTELFDGFEPLFNALTPKQANQLASDVVAVFQGEGGGITALLTNIATLTKNLSDRDGLIGQVIDNLDVVIGGVAQHSGDLATLINELQSLTSGLSADRHQIADSLNGLNDVATSLNGLISKGEPVLHHDIGDLYLVAGTLVKNQKTLQAAVQALPKGAAAFTRALGYGSWLNGYICSLGVQSGKLIVPVKVGGKTLHSAVCPG
jgi:phospholipid/cholesterol/gamma-HCH transport system substrate-binding protein